MNDHHISYQELSEYKWVSKLMFFADFSEYLNELNVKFKGSGKALDVTFGYIKAFEKKLEVFETNIGDERFRCFSNLMRHINDLQNNDRTDFQSLQKLFKELE